MFGDVFVAVVVVVSLSYLISHDDHRNMSRTVNAFVNLVLLKFLCSLNPVEKQHCKVIEIQVMLENMNDGEKG